MIAKVLLLAVFFCAASAQEGFADVVEGLNRLKNMTDEGSRKVDEVLTVLNSARRENEKMVEDRVDCLNWEYKTQRDTLNKSIVEAVFKGMQKNKAYASYQCISYAAREAFDKIDAIFSKVPENYQKIHEKGLSGVLPFRLIIPGLKNYIQDLYQKKHDDLLKEKKESERTKILEEVEKKMKLLGDILNQIKNKVKDSRFQFFAEFVDYVHATENNYRKVQKEGCQKIQKCVA